jgi:hypothetical protein
VAVIKRKSSRTAAKINPNKIKSQKRRNINVLPDQTPYISNKELTKMRMLLGIANKTAGILLPVFLHCSGFCVNKNY